MILSRARLLDESGRPLGGTLRSLRDVGALTGRDHRLLDRLLHRRRLHASIGRSCCRRRRRSVGRRRCTWCRQASRPGWCRHWCGRYVGLFVHRMALTWTRRPHRDWSGHRHEWLRWLDVALLCASLCQLQQIEVESHHRLTSSFRPYAQLPRLWSSFCCESFAITDSPEQCEWDDQA